MRLKNNDFFFEVGDLNSYLKAFLDVVEIFEFLAQASHIVAQLVRILALKSVRVSL